VGAKVNTGPPPYVSIFICIVRITYSKNEY
jgi:hypothetical protein